MPRLAAVAADAPGLEVVVVLGDDADVGDVPFRRGHVRRAARRTNPPTISTPPKIWDLAMMIYTSGTTGPSKGVLLAWAQVHEGTVGLIPPDDLDETDCFYSPFPMFHAQRAGRAVSHGELRRPVRRA